MTLVEGGPVMLRGPVEMELPDGTTVRSDRPVVAICACRRSKRYPFCDTSHRRRERPSRSAAGSGSEGASNDDRPSDHDASR